ncbi:MAG: hypothetical protein ACPGN3_06855 [Opitutales bacterium]
MLRRIIIFFLVLTCGYGAEKIPIRLTAIVAVGDQVMCSILNQQTKKRHWLKEKEMIPGLEDVLVWRIHPKKEWVEIKKEDNSYPFALTGMLINNQPMVISVEDSGLSNMVRIHQERQKRRETGKK